MRKKQPTNAEVEAAMPRLCPHYHHAMTLIEELAAWGRAGFPGASLADIVKVASNNEPELLLGKIRRRSGRNVKKLLLGIPIDQRRA